jgi:hypothetical protein
MASVFGQGYGRAGAGYFGLGQYEEAVKVYEEGLKVDGVRRLRLSAVTYAR